MGRHGPHEVNYHSGRRNPKPPHRTNHDIGPCDRCGQTDELLRVNGSRVCAPCLELGISVPATLASAPTTS